MATGIRHTDPGAALTEAEYVDDAAHEIHADVDLDSHKLINVADPTADQDAATKKFVATALLTLCTPPATNDAMRWLNGPAITSATPFSAQITGTPTSTTVVYDGETNENLMDIEAAYWGRMILYNTTRGNSRKVSSCNLGTNTITTDASVDDWADNDALTTQSPTCQQAGYFEVDLSANIPAGATVVALFATLEDLADAADANRTLFFHPYVSYASGKRLWLTAAIALEKSALYFLFPVYSQKICMMVRATSTANVAIILIATGYA